MIINTVKLFNLNVFSEKKNNLHDIINSILFKNKKVAINFVNVNKVVLTNKDKNFYNDFNQSEILVVDGYPVYFLSKLLKSNVKERIAGVDLMFELINIAIKKNFTMYFLGSTDNVLQKIKIKIMQDYSSNLINGYHDGYFTQEEELKVVEEINKLKPKIVFLGFPSPRKEQFSNKYKELIDTNLIVSVGGSFDIFAGVKKRAPKFLQIFGFEWLFRVMQEPNRLMSRYFKNLIAFIPIAIKEFISVRWNKL